MKIQSVELIQFKRFTHLKITDIPESAKLIMLIGSNGSGKTSLFEAFRQWSGRWGGTSFDSDESYLSKNESNFNNFWQQNIKVNFHQDTANGSEAKRKLFYIRSAYRNEPDFTISSLGNLQSRLDSPRINRLIDNDASVSENYQRIVSNSVKQLYSGSFDSKNVLEVREELIGKIRQSTLNIFEDLTLTSVGDPLKKGAFYFKKGIVENFHFKNLSGGEKAAFDLIVDIITQSLDFDNSVYCIDEPDLHLHTKLQGKVLKELYELVPDNCQLIISTHSIGMIRKAVEMQKQKPEEVVFLDFHDKNLDEEVTLKPVKVTRDLWKKILEVALDDLSELISPKQIVICEGKPINLPGKNKEFDAQCLRVIFNEEFADTDFISIGSEQSVRAEKIDLVSTLKFLNKGINFIKVIDRDDRSEEEIKELREKESVRVLKRRDIESYLLDDEIIEKLCIKVGKNELTEECNKIKEDALIASVARGNPTDDIKSAAGTIYNELKTTLSLTQCGNSANTFLRDTMARLVTPETNVYLKLKEEIFG